MFEIYINDELTSIDDLDNYTAEYSYLMDCYIDRDTCDYSYDDDDNIALISYFEDNNYRYCEDIEAYSNNYIYTQDTNEYYTYDYAKDNLYQCNNCYDWYCESSSGYFHDNEWYCDSCYDELELDDIIYGYHEFDAGYYPRKLANEKPLYLGFELEVDNTREDNNEIAKSVLENDDYNMLHCERDSSVEFEFISQPATLDYHKSMNYNNWFFDNLKGKCQSHDAGTCGLHVHVNRDFFTDKGYERLKTILEFYKKEIFVFSRRQEWNYEYANFGDETPKRDVTIKKSADKKSYGHYTWFNESNTRTLEFRMFRGTLVFETFMPTLELVHNICTLANSNQSIITWNDLIAGDYCKSYSLKRDIHCDDILDFDELERKEQEREEKERKEILKYDRMVFLSQERNPSIFITIADDNQLKMYYLSTNDNDLEKLKKDKLSFVNFCTTFDYNEIKFLKRNYIQLMKLDDFLGGIQ